MSFNRNNNSNIFNIEDLDIPLYCIEISIQSCRLTNIPKDFFMKFKDLESLNLQNNCIENMIDLPPNLTYFNISYNKLKEFRYDAINNIHLEYIDVKYNYIKEYPIILNMPEDLIIDYKGNNQEYDRLNGKINPYINRGINQNVNRNAKQNIINATNVHETTIQSNTHKSIEYLLSTIDNDNDKFKYDSLYMLGIIDTYREIIINEMTCMKKLFGNHGNLILNYKKLLEYYDELPHNIIYDYSNDKSCTMSQILERIWVIAKNKTEENKKSIICNLIIQIEDGEKHCFVGKFTRVVSSLVSFDENIKIEISFPIRFANFVDLMKKNNTYTKDNFNRFINDSELEDNEKNKWLDSVNEMFE